MSYQKKAIGDSPVYDARVLGKGRMAVLGLQHMFAMFGATVLVPVLTGLPVSTTLLFAGLGTLLFHLISKRKVPAFLGSSFAFLAGYAAIAPHGEENLLPYACFGVAVAGLMYLVLAALFRAFGANRVMRYFPPIVTGPIIIAIGLNLSKSAVDNCETNWGIALVAIVVIIICNIWGRGMIKIIPIIMGVLASYLVAARLCHDCLAAACQQGTEHHDAAAQLLAAADEVVAREVVVVEVLGAEGVVVGIVPCHLYAHVVQHLYLVVDIDDVGDVLDAHGFVGEQCGTEHLQGLVLCALRCDLAFQPVAAFDDE